MKIGKHIEIEEYWCNKSQKYYLTYILGMKVITLDWELSLYIASIINRRLIRDNIFMPIYHKFSKHYNL